MKNLLKEYKEFINKGDVIMVAVALVMALYFKAIVDQIIEALIKPLVALIFNADDIRAIDFTISGTTFPIGLVFGAIIDFIAVAVILFFIVKAYNRWKASEPAAPTEVDILTEIRDTLQQQRN
ncbi:MAG TPA: MscL family protein [Ilumatobacteraceae bacterium]